MKISDYLTKEEIKYFTKKDDAKGWQVFLTNWLAILAIMAVMYHFTSIFTLVIGFILLGGRQLGLAILMHDSGHKTLFETPELNDIIGHWFCALPVMSNLPAYRAGHLRHHQLAGTKEDPDLNNYIVFPVDKESFKRKLMRDIKGETGLKLLKGVFSGVQAAFSSESVADKNTDSENNFIENPFVQLMLAQAVIFVMLSILFSPIMYLVWAASFLTTFMLIIRLRQIAEHANVPDLFDLDPRKNTRTTVPRPWERLVFAPNYVNYHLEHHFMASVPCYHLKELHEHLVAKGAYEDTKIFKGYLSVFRHAVI